MKEQDNHLSVTAIPDDLVLNKIYFIRGQKVMLDTDSAEH
jgi:hypothetical protein